MLIEKLNQKYRNADIATKLTVAYVGCFVILLALINAVMYFGVFYVLYRPAERAITHSMESIKNHLDLITKSNLAFNPYAMTAPLVDGVILRVIDDEGEIFADTGPQYISNERFDEYILSSKPIFANNNFDIADNGDALIYRAKMDYTILDQHFNLLFFRTITSEKLFLDNLERLLIALDIFGIIFAVAFGKFISNKILNPIKTITDYANNIQFGKINDRISVPTDNDELSDLAKTINAMLDRLQLGIDNQSAFVHNASHELRTPAAVFANYAELLDTYGNNDAKLFNESVNAIKAEAAYLSNLLKNLAAIANFNTNLNMVNIKLN